MKSYLNSIFILVALILVGTGCSTARIALSPENALPVKFEGGWTVATSSKANTVTLKIPNSSFDSRQNAPLYVIFANYGETPINVSTNNVRALLGENQKELKIYTYDKLKRKLEREAAWQTFAVALNAGMASANAAQPATTYSSGNYTGGGNFNAYGNNNTYGDINTYSNYNAYGNWNTYGTINEYSSTYDPAATAQAQAAINANASSQFDNISRQKESAVGSLASMVRLTTVDPQQYYGGFLQLKVPYPTSTPKPVSLIITFDEEDHEFKLQYGKP